MANQIFSLILLTTIFWAIPVFAEEEVTTTTTPEIIEILATTTVEIPTTTPEVILPAPEIINQTQINEAINKILNYLKSQQSEDGKIMDGTITDWSIISFGANGQYANDIKTATTSLLDYEKKYNLDDPSDLNSCATYPRHILALLSAGVEPTDSAILGLKEKMNTICYKNNLYGLNGINDDIFALLALSALDTNQSEPIMQDIVSTTLAWQIENGAFSWPDWMDPNSKVAGDDITGAAMNALKYAQTKGAVISDEIFTKAKTYLKSTQQTDGGWGFGSSDIMTTSWVLMGVNALGENQNDWFVNSTGKNPWHPLVNNLKADGFYESAWVPGTVDWFAMKHAVPALAGKSWPIVLSPIVKNFSEGATFTYGGGGGSYTPPVIEIVTTTPTTTLATTTLEIATTTLELISPTSTISTSTTEITTTTIEITTSTPITTVTENQISIHPRADKFLATPKFLKQKITETPKINEAESIKKEFETTEIISSPNTSTVPISPAKIAFATSISAAGGLGAYLAWRLLQSLL